MTQSRNKPFVVLLFVAVALGVGIGGIFAGGVALGKSSGGDTPTSLSLSGPVANSADGAGQGRFSRGQGGQVDPLAPQSQGPTSGDAAVQSFPGRGGVTGTVDKVDGNLVTITTSEGPVEVIIAEDTPVSRIAEASVDDLQPGVQVTVMGPAGEAGRVEAANLVITPEGLEGPFGRGQRDGQGFRRGAEAP